MDPIMGVSSLYCYLAVLLHSVFVFTYPSSVPDFRLCFVFCFSFSSCGCLPCVHLHPTPSVFIFILVTDKKHCTMFCTMQEILLLGVNNFSEYNIFYNVNPFSVLFLFLESEITKLNSTILSFLGFNWGERLFRDLVVHRKQGPVSQKKPWHCTLIACLHNGTCVITSCFL